jgi:adenylate cyclase
VKGGSRVSEAEEIVSKDAVRAELGRILASPGFDASERNRRFLAHVVEEALAGRADRIKAFSIATSVFGRDERFDPQVDSIVRIEAGRLRRSLERFYLTDGRTSRVRIDIPRGRYAPVFRSLPGEAAQYAPTGAPRVLVTAFEEEGDQSSFPSFTRGFTRSLIIALTRFTGLRVFGADTALHRPADADAPPIGHPLDADYVVTGQTALLADGFEVDVLLIEARTGRAVWAETFERRQRPSEIIALRNEVANRVARALAQPYGAIPSDLARDAEGGAPETLGSYAAVLRFHAYWRTFDRGQIEPVRHGLERAVAAEPGYAEAFACLSLVYSNAHRFGHPIGDPGLDPHERALALAVRAVDLAPASSHARYALGLARWFTGNVAGALDALAAGRALNPNDMTIAADLGQRYAILGRWGEGVPLLEEAYAVEPAQPGSYRIGLFLYHFAHGRFSEALDEARRIDAPQVLYGHVAVAAAAAELGLVAEAGAAVGRIRSLDPGYGTRVAADLESRHLAPDLVTLVVAGLAKAGLDMPAQERSTAPPSRRDGHAPRMRAVVSRREGDR